MIYFQKSNFFSLFIVLSLLVACGIRDTRYFPVFMQSDFYCKQLDTLSVAVKSFSAADCDDYFGVNVIDSGYIVLQIVIENKGSERYVFYPSYLDLQRTSGNGIAKLLHYDTYQRMLWLSLPALFFWWQAIPFLIVPYGISCRHYNNKKTFDICSKALSREDSLHVGPYECIKKFIFVPIHAFRPKFNLSFLNQESKKLITFNVNLN